MSEATVRIDFVTDKGETLWCVFHAGDDGQYGLVATGEVGPFDSALDTFRQIAVALMRYGALATL